MPLMRKTANTRKKQMTAKKTCKHGACWKKARMSSGRRGGQQTRETKEEESHSSITVENRKQSQFEPKEIIAVKDKLVKVRVTMDSGAAGHVKLETMFPRVKLERKTSPKKRVAASEPIRHLGEPENSAQNIWGNSEVHNGQECECLHASHLNAKSNPSWKRCRAG